MLGGWGLLALVSCPGVGWYDVGMTCFLVYQGPNDVFLRGPNVQLTPPNTF